MAQMKSCMCGCCPACALHCAMRSAEIVGVTGFPWTSVRFMRFSSMFGSLRDCVCMRDGLCLSASYVHHAQGSTDVAPTSAFCTMVLIQLQLLCQATILWHVCSKGKHADCWICCVLAIDGRTGESASVAACCDTLLYGNQPDALA